MGFIFISFTNVKPVILHKNKTVQPVNQFVVNGTFLDEDKNGQKLTGKNDEIDHGDHKALQARRGA